VAADGLARLGLNSANRRTPGKGSMVRALAEGRNGVMVAINPPRIEYVPLRQAVARMKTVPLDPDGIVTARTFDISLGN
jgi:hypothetical protein